MIMDWEHSRRRPRAQTRYIIPAIQTNAEYGFQTFGQSANPNQGGASTISQLPDPGGLHVGLERPAASWPSWVASADYTGIRGIHLLMPLWWWSLNNVPVARLFARASLSRRCPTRSLGSRRHFDSEPTVQLSQLLGLSPQYSSITPGQATWGRRRSNFLNLQMQSRGYHGLTLWLRIAFERR